MLFILRLFIVFHFKIGHLLLGIFEFISLKLTSLKLVLLHPFNRLKQNESSSPTDTFKYELHVEYAVNLLRTTNEDCVKKSMEVILYILRNNKLTRLQGECLYYLAVCYAKLKDYNKALIYCQYLLVFNPNCEKTKCLLSEIQLRAAKDGQNNFTIMKHPMSN
ncbi:unnamed protein product [Heterobilharzia americana]|nr:unnamed protein product [Heterobilharzia americana]